MKSPRTTIARQLGLPHGTLGRIIGRGMARANGDFSRWVVGQLAQRRQDGTGRIAELGPGPGIGLEALLRCFPDAQVWGIDPSTTMLAQSRRRNSAAAAHGQLALLLGGVSELTAIAPLDIVMANHVLYFWREPTTEMRQIRASLRNAGVLALGYQLRAHMPSLARRQFPEAGHRLYDSVDHVTELLHEAGFASTAHLLMGPPETPHGHLTLAFA